MSSEDSGFIQGTVIGEDEFLTLLQLCSACSVDQELVLIWVFEGVLEPLGQSPPDWRFGDESLRRARQAARLTRELELNPAGVALVLDLLDEIALLRVRLQRANAA